MPAELKLEKLKSSLQEHLILNTIFWTIHLGVDTMIRPLFNDEHKSSNENVSIYEKIGMTAFQDSTMLRN